MSVITGRTRRKEVLLSIYPKNYNFQENKNSQVMKERGNFHLNVALYTVSIVIETKIVTGWFKLQHWMWLAVELSDNKLSSELVGNRIYKSITIKECNFYDHASNRFITQRNPFPSFGLILLKCSCEEKFACSYCLHWPISPLPRNLHSGTRKLSKNYQFFKQTQSFW